MGADVLSLQAQPLTPRDVSAPRPFGRSAIAARARDLQHAIMQNRPEVLSVLLHNSPSDSHFIDTLSIPLLEDEI